GEPLELVAREANVSIARLSEWRERALAGAATALKERERDDRDDEIARLKSKVGEITMHPGGSSPLRSLHRRGHRCGIPACVGRRRRSGLVDATVDARALSCCGAG